MWAGRPTSPVGPPTTVRSTRLTVHPPRPRQETFLDHSPPPDGRTATRQRRIRRHEPPRRPSLRRHLQGCRDPDPRHARRGGDLPHLRGDPVVHGSGRRVHQLVHRLRRPARVRHDLGGVPRPGHRHPVRRRRRAVHQPLRTASDRPPARRLRRPARRHPERRLRHLGHQRARPDPVPQRVPVARGQPRLHPAVQGPGLVVRSHDHDRRPGARRDDPADHHRHLAGGVPPDATSPRGGIARPRRHPLGDDPPSGPARTVAPG